MRLNELILSGVLWHLPSCYHSMRTLVFDIETVGEEWESLDEVTKHTLTHWIETSSRNEDEKAKLLSDIKSGLGLSPFTGQIVSLALYDIEQGKGAVYYRSDATADEAIGNWHYKARSEAELLKDWWKGVKQYDAVVTYNGRSFDAPFLVHRSVVHDVTPSVNLLQGRYPYQQKEIKHIDLQDEVTFYGALYRRPSLHLVCRAYGIESPKTEVSGEDVAELFRQKKFRDIATYNICDVVATTKLYDIWCRNNLLQNKIIDPEWKIDY